MKCNNPKPCDGEMKPIQPSDGGADSLECMKCGWRIPADIKTAAPKAAPTLPTENKEN